jgi:sugar lactone lactonase YvrE
MLSTCHAARRLPLRTFVCLIGGLLTGASLVGCASSQPTDTAKSASFWPPAPNEPRIQYLAGFEKSSDIEPPKSDLDKIILGKDPIQVLPIAKPYGVKMWKQKIYVCDISQHGLVILDLKQRLSTILGTTGAVRMQTPSDVAISSDGTKYVADLGRQAVFAYGPDDKYLATFLMPESKPVAIAVHGDELAVADFQGSRIVILNRYDGQQKRVVGSPGTEDGQFMRPLAVAYDKSGNIFVNDFMRCRISKFSPDGKFLKGFGGASTAAGDFIRPKHIAVDADETLFVVDAAFQNVQMIDGEGHVLTFFGSAGKHAGSMYLPAGICIVEDPEDVAMFKDFAHPAFDVQRLVLVTNQFGEAKVAVYGYGKLKAGKKVSDISGSRNVVPSGLDTNPATRDVPTTLPADLPPDAPRPGAPTPAATGAR